MGSPEYRKPPYSTAKPKQFGNLHERMHYVKVCKEHLRKELEAIIPHDSKASDLANELFVGIMDLETEVAQYHTDKRPRAR